MPITLLGTTYVLWRTADGIAAALPKCPHRGGNLVDGWVHDGCVVCPYHGWEYDSTGRCVHIPHLEADLPVPSKARIDVVHAQERYGMVWICPGEPAGPLPVWPEGEDPRFRLYVEFFELRSTSALRVVDNALDLSHVTFVHRGTFGSQGGLTIPPVPDIEPTTNAFLGRFTYEMPGVAAQIGLEETAPGTTFERTTEIEMLGPLALRTRFYFRGFADETRDYSFLGAAMPIDDTSAMYVRITALGGTEEEHPFEPFHAFSMRVQDEDRRILDGTAPEFPLSITGEVHIRLDRLTLEYRRYLADLHARYAA